MGGSSPCSFPIDPGGAGFLIRTFHEPICGAGLPRKPRCCQKLLPTRLRTPVIACFLRLEPRYLNDLILIRFCLARATRAGSSRTEPPANPASLYFSCIFPVKAGP